MPRQFSLAFIGQHGQKHLDVVQPQITQVEHAPCLSAIKRIKMNLIVLYFLVLKLYYKYEPARIPDRASGGIAIGDAHILAVFEEIRSELQNTEEKNIDFSFLGLFPKTATP